MAGKSDNDYVRIIIHPVDVLHLLGIKLNAAQKRLTRMKKMSDKTRTQYLVASEMSLHTGLPLDHIMDYLRKNPNA